MKKFLLSTLVISAVTNVSIAQITQTVNQAAVKPVTSLDKGALTQVKTPSLLELSVEINKLKGENKELQTKLDALQKQVTANYKVQDMALGLVSKKVDEIPAVEAFTVTASAGTLADSFQPIINYGSGTYYKAVIIDNELCNGNPAAKVFATAQTSSFGYNTPAALAVVYDKNIGKWKIRINADIVNPYNMGLAKPTGTATYMVSVASYSPYQIMNGDKFNVVIIK